MEVVADVFSNVEIERQREEALARARLTWPAFTGIVGQNNDTIMARHPALQLEERHAAQHPGDLRRALEFANAAVTVLTNAVEQNNCPAVVTTWFKLNNPLDEEQLAALTALKAQFIKIAASLEKGGSFYYSTKPPGRSVAAQAERRFGMLWRTSIALYPLHVADTDAERRATTLVHEASHHIVDTSDWVFSGGRDIEVYVYGAPSNEPQAPTRAWQDITWKGRIGNADTFAYFARACRG